MSRLQESLVVPGASRHPIVRGAVVGAGLGVLWGIGARVFMRLITDNPGFSWAGTLFILGLSALMGLGLGVVAAAKASGARRWWLLSLLPGLLLLAGQGMPFIPAFALGGLLFTRRHVVLRAVGAVAIASGALVLWDLVHLNEETMLSLPTPVLVRGMGAFTLLSVAMAAGASVLWRRWADLPAPAVQVQLPVPASSGLAAPAGPTRAHS